MWVFDATPLIYLAKTESLAHLTAVDERCVIPERVAEEVIDAGIDGGYPDARRVERHVENGLLETVAAEETDLFSRLQRNPKLSDADRAVLAAAADADGVAIMDEVHGRAVADTEDVTTRGTAYVVLWLVREGEIGAADGRETIDAMLDNGWYCAPDMYAKLVGKLEELAV
jgi:predicted nucleic acid-binding protein